MLVLSRRKDERILLTVNGEEIEVTVVRIDANKVRLGIQASDKVTILRAELLESCEVTEPAAPALMPI